MHTCRFMNSDAVMFDGARFLFGAISRARMDKYPGLRWSPLPGGWVAAITLHHYPALGWEPLPSAWVGAITRRFGRGHYPALGWGPLPGA